MKSNVAEKTRNQSAYTRGPWRVEKCECKHPACNSYYVRGPIFHDRGLTDEPDARLIAAAPELLQALKDAAQHLDYCGYGDKWERECAAESGLRERIEAVIFKATEGK